MKEVSRDGVLAVHPENDGGLALAFPAGDLTGEALEQLHAGDPTMQLAGRSAAGQLGIDVVRRMTDSVAMDEAKTLYVPIKLETHTPTAQAVAEDIGNLQAATKPGDTLTWGGKRIEFGRLLDHSNLKRLEREEVEEAIKQRLIAFKPSDGRAEDYRVNDDGSVSLPLSLLEFVFNDAMLESPEQRFNALHHGRAGLIPHSDSLQRTADDTLPAFMVGGVVFSAGPFYVNIRENLDDAGAVRQLPSAAFFDGNRLMGTNRRLDAYSRHRQVEIANTNAWQTFNDSWVTVDIFRSTSIAERLNPAIDWASKNLVQRQEIHEHGVSPLSVIRASDRTLRTALFEAVSSASDTAALVISAHGITEVKRGLTDNFTAANVGAAARSFGRYREIPEHLADLGPFVAALKPASDRSRLVVADRLDPSHITDIATTGDVRAFLLGSYLGEGEAGVAIRSEIHKGLVRLVRQGVSIAWENGGNFRQLHRSGLWLTPEGADRIEELDLVLAMYGSHQNGMGDTLAKQIDEFLDQLSTSDSLPVTRSIGVTHGNMGGIMAATDVSARAHGIMSLGIGLDLSDAGQKEVNMGADGFLILGKDDRLPRQEMMDKFNTISIFNAGGYGTLEELYITICSQKLNGRLPTPNILVAADNLYQPVQGLVNNVADRGLGQAWVSRSFRLVKDYDAAAKVIEEFWNDPGAYWEAIGISKEHLELALRRQKDILDEMGMRLSGRLEKAAEEFIASH